MTCTLNQSLNNGGKPRFHIPFSEIQDFTYRFQRKTGSRSSSQATSSVAKGMQERGPGMFQFEFIHVLNKAKQSAPETSNRSQRENKSPLNTEGLSQRVINKNKPKPNFLNFGFNF